jgi:ankyrin repeat protein/beta-lactamase regulating signal transducer with metallopeptidase domain
MNGWVNLFSEPWVQRLGWVLIHFLWQGAGIALLLAVALRLFARASSHIRYVTIGSALLLCAVMPVATWIILSPQAQLSVLPAPASNPTELPKMEAPAALGPGFRQDAGFDSLGSAQMRWQDNLRRMADAAVPYVVGLWFGGVLILTLRLTLAWTLMRRLCLSGLAIQDSRCLERFRGLVERMQVGVPVRLLQSALVEVPTLIGWLRPTILVPVSVFTGLTPEQLEAILAHELAHVRRYDYLVNLFQTVIETILFYHPAIWWISRKLREERENCCDDIALEVMQDRLVYVSALAQLEEGRGLPLALTASGGSLLQRIRRIAGVNDRKVSAWPLWILIIGVLSLGGLNETKGTETPSTPEPRAQTYLQVTYIRTTDTSAMPGPFTLSGIYAEKFIQNPLNVVTKLADFPLKTGINTFKGKTPAGFDFEITLDWNDSSTNKAPNIDVDLKWWKAKGGDVSYRSEFKELLRRDECILIKGPWKTQETSNLLIRFVDHLSEKPQKDNTDVNATDATGRKLAAADQAPDLNAQLLAAVLKGDAVTVQKLLDQGADPNARGENGDVPLFSARSAAMVDLLIAHGADPRLKSNNGNDALDYVSWQDPSVFDALLRGGVPFDVKADGPTKLLQASLHGNTLLMAKLLALGVDPNTPGAWSRDGPKVELMTPMTGAVNSGVVSAVELLLDHGAKTEGGKAKTMVFSVVTHPAIAKLLWDRGNRDVSPLLYAISQGASVQAIAKLLDEGSPPDPPQDDELTPLGAVVEKGNLDAVKLLVARGADVNKGSGDSSPMRLAAFNGGDEVVAYLLAHGAKADPMALWEAAHNSTPYQGERSKEHFEKVVRLLLDAGALKNATPELQGSIVNAPIWTRQGPPNATVLKMILDAGGNPNAPMPFTAENGEKPNTVIGHYRDYCAQHRTDPFFGTGWVQIKPLLKMLEAAAKGSVPKATGASDSIPNPALAQVLVADATQGDTAEVERLPKLKADLNLSDASFGGGSNTLISPLAAADHSGQVSLDEVHPFLAPFVWSRGNRIGSPLLYAISQEASIEDIAKLLSQGSPADPPEDKQVTPLGAAAKFGNLEAVKLLVAHHADVNAGGPINTRFPELTRMSPLWLAASEGQDEVVEYLLQQGAKPEPAALWQAVYNGSPYPNQRSKDHFEKTVRILIDAGALKTAKPEMAGAILEASLGTRMGSPNGTVLKMLLDAGLSPDLPLGYSVVARSKPDSVINCYRDYYNKNKDDPVFGDRVLDLKPLLDMLEAAVPGH